MPGESKQLILVVDDRDSNVRFLQTVLTRAGYEVITAYDGPSAVEQFDKFRPALVTLDVMLPGMDGFEVCRILKSHKDNPFVHVVMLTSLSTPEDRLQGLKSGADEFISKPVRTEELLTRVRNALKNQAVVLQLEQAYKQLSGLTRQNDILLRDFNPFRFDPFSTENQLLSSLIRPPRTDDGRAEKVFLASLGKPRLEIRLYQRLGFPETALKADLFHLPAELFYDLLEPGTLYFSNFDPAETAPWTPPPELTAAVGPIHNLVTCCTDHFLLAALNYGRNVSRFDAQVLKSQALHLNFFDTLARQSREVEEAFRYMIFALARAAEANDEGTGSHIRRSNAFASFIAEKLGLSPKEVEVIGYSAQMHDVGKVHIHPNILLKNGILTVEEYEVIKTHTLHGARILGDSPRLSTARRIAISHHEKWDGTGYPYGLKGENISLEGRIVALADVYDALRSERPYKPAFSHDRSYEIITQGDGRTHPKGFDPKILKIFMEHHQVFDEIYETCKDRE